MPLPVFTTAPARRAHQYTGKVTWTVLFTVLIGSSGGAMFGYDIGVTGGVTSMHSWQVKFFPNVITEEFTATSYCKLNDKLVQLFTSSLYLAGMISSLFAGYLTQRLGRRVMMITAGALFIFGTALQASAQDLAMLICGRVVLGVGVGFANQCVPVFLSEIAPHRIRGACTIAFQMTCTIAIFSAELINYHMEKYTVADDGQGWRYSLGFAAIPGFMLCIGSLFLPDSPNSLVERGRLDQARAVLEYIRASPNVDAEFDDIVDAARAASLVTNQWSTIMTRRYRPQLVVSILVPLFQQLTGINSIMFYAPQVFSALGHSQSTSLLNTVTVGAVNVAATLVAIALVDRVGRRIIFLTGGIQMGATLIVVGVVLGVEFNKNAVNLPVAVDKGMLAVICLFVASFAWSWGPLGWLVPSEIQPLETRSAGQAITVFCNFLMSFIIGQSFLSMLCAMEYGVFLFFAGFVVLMTIFSWCLIPETNGVPIEEMQDMFQAHWFWGSIMGAPRPSSTPSDGSPCGSTSRVTVATSADLKTALRMAAFGR